MKKKIDVYKDSIFTLTGLNCIPEVEFGKYYKFTFYVEIRPTPPITHKKGGPQEVKILKYVYGKNKITQKDFGKFSYPTMILAAKYRNNSGTTLKIKINILAGLIESDVNPQSLETMQLKIKVVKFQMFKIIRFSKISEVN